MTEDSSDNLRKFLGSDDPAMILLGLSLAKGSGKVSNDVLGIVLGLYLFHDDKTIRSLAKAIFGKSASSDIRKTVKNYWQAEYRAVAWIWDGWMQKMVVTLESLGINTTYLLVRGLIMISHEITQSNSEEVENARGRILEMLEKRDMSVSYSIIRSLLKNLLSVNFRSDWWQRLNHENAEIASKILKQLDSY